MTLRLVETVQARLKDLGWYGGAVDDIAGPATSMAVMDFKRAHGFVERDYLGPLTLALLFSAGAKRRVSVSPAAGRAGDVPPWYTELLKMLGKHERTDNAELRAWLKSDGSTLGDPAVLPWCGDGVETAIKLTLPGEPVPANPYLARNWLTFGQPCAPVLGAVAVFSRPPSTTSGHVAFVAGEDAETIHVLGTNQQDSVSLTRIVRSRLLGCRWPTSYPMTTSTVARAAEGAVSTNEA